MAPCCGQGGAAQLRLLLPQPLAVLQQQGRLVMAGKTRGQKAIGQQRIEGFADAPGHMQGVEDAVHRPWVGPDLHRVALVVAVVAEGAVLGQNKELGVGGLMHQALQQAGQGETGAGVDHAGAAQEEGGGSPEALPGRLGPRTGHRQDRQLQ